MNASDPPSTPRRAGGATPHPAGAAGSGTGQATTAGPATAQATASTVPAPAGDARLLALRQWLQPLSGALGVDAGSLRSASDDASFRRYFRIDADPARCGADTVIVMDAPPPHEDVRPFLHAARVLAEAGLSVPAVLAADAAQGFVVLQDLGTVMYADALNDASAATLYGDASEALVRLQSGSRPGVFPDYDHDVLLREMRLYPQWYLQRHKGVTPDERQHAVIESAFEAIARSVLAQARVYVHRDWHCRNLMVLPAPRNPGVLDFQDALYGPVTYDLVSMVRDAYVTWDEAMQIDVCARHWERARRAGLPVPADFADFYRDVEWMGLQRHLKVLGIFARLHHRDGKSRYLADLPRVLDHVLGVTRRYRELAAFNALIERIEQRLPQVGHTF